MSGGLFARLRAEASSRLARDTLTVLAFSGLGRVAALGKEMLVAALFGVGGRLDAYVLAFLIPSLLVNIFGAAFASALIPALGRAAAAGPGTNGSGVAPRRMLRAGLGLQAGLLLCAGLGLYALPDAALRPLAPMLAPERLGLVKALQTALLPLFVLASLSQTMAACVNFRGGFRGPAAASTLGALATIAVIAASHGAFSHDGLDLYALVAGVNAGAGLEFCLLAWMLRRAWRVNPSSLPMAKPSSLSMAKPSSCVAPAGPSSGTAAAKPPSHAASAMPCMADAEPSSDAATVAPDLDAPSAGVVPEEGPETAAARGAFVRALVRDWSLLALGAGTLALSSFIDNAIASTLGEGAVSVLSYAWKLPAGFATLLGLTLSTVLLPYFTDLANSAPAAAMLRSCRRVVVRLLGLAAPLAAICALASPLLVALLFQRGRFDAQAAGLVGVTQACYFVQLPFYLLCIVTQRMLQALSRFRFLFRLQAGLVVLNALTCYGLSRVFGVAGIAVSSTLMYALMAGVSLIVLRRRLLARAEAA